MLQQIQRTNDQYSPLLIQPQLETGKDDDEYEKEANLVAGNVMRMTDTQEKKMPDVAGKKMAAPLISKMPVNAIQKMPAGKSPNDTDPEKLGDLSADQKKGLKIQTDGSKLDFSKYFASSVAAETPLSSDVKLLYGNIPAALQPGFKKVAGMLVGSKIGVNDYFPLNTTITLALDFNLAGNLKDIKLDKDSEAKYAGATIAYSFTFFGDGAGKTILIEELGPVKFKAEKRSEDKTVFSKYFDLGKGLAGDELNLFVGTVNNIDDKILSLAAANGKKIIVNREPNNANGDAAQYDVMSHTLTVYDPFFALENSDVIFGDAKSGFTSGMVYTLIHELGHVVDYVPFKPVYDDYVNLYTQYSNNQTQENLDKVTEAGKLVQATETVSGNALGGAGKMEPKTSAPTNTLPVSPYAAVSGMEAFAESFAMYSVEPEKLKQLRPDHYTFLQEKYKFYKD